MRLQEMRQALVTAAELDLEAELHGERQALLDRIADLAETGREEAGDPAVLALSDAKVFLRRLAPELTQ